MLKGMNKNINIIYGTCRK